MQILQHGNKAPIITCTTCNCQFLYTEADVVKKTVGETLQRSVICPECGTETILTEE